MYYDPSFQTRLSIESITTNNYVSTIMVKFLTLKESTETKEYRLWIENLADGTIEVANSNTYVIDRLNQNDLPQNDNSYVEINRNKTVPIKINLTHGNVFNNRFTRNCRLHLKENVLSFGLDKSVWISDNIVLSSREIQIPEIICDKAVLIDGAGQSGKIKCKIEFKYKSGRDETNFNTYLFPFVLFFDNHNLFATEAVIGTDIGTCHEFISTNVYGKNVNRIRIEILFANGTVAASKDIVVDTFRNFAAFYATDDDILKCLNLGIIPDATLYSGNNKFKIVNLYQKP